MTGGDPPRIIPLLPFVVKLASLPFIYAAIRELAIHGSEKCASM